MRGQRVISETVPLALAIIFTLYWYWPVPDQFVGWGGDPYLVIWLFEHAWHAMRDQGAGFIFSEAFVKAPIFHPFPFSFHLTEAFTIPAILTFPLRQYTHHPAMTLQIFALLTSMASFFFTRAWLRRLGLASYAALGACLFCACGWIQDHYAHYQNTFIFLFPLAFWRLEAFRQAQTPRNGLIAGVLCGWLFGWNAYFQVFINLAVFIWVLGTIRNFRNSFEALLFFGITFGATEFFFAINYLKVAQVLGTVSLSSDEFLEFSATLHACVSHAMHPTYLQRHFGSIYPVRIANIETVGFLGLVWTLLLLARFSKVTDGEFRLWAVLFVFFEALSFGPRLPFFDAAVHFPGVGAARAIGRAQVLVALTSIPLILKMLSETRKSFGKIALSATALLLVVEQIPGSGPMRTRLPIEWSNWDENFSPLETWLASYKIGRDEIGWFVVGADPGTVQFNLMRSQAPLALGYSGRTPPVALALSKPGLDVQALIKNQVRHLMTVDEGTSELMRASEYLEPLGCRPHLGKEWCAFRVRS